MQKELLKQLRIAVIGIPDSGKSTFIKNAVKVITGKCISPDTLMNEVHYSDGKDIYGNNDTRTIKCAKIFFKYKDYEICMYDCPGHLEYNEQIKQGIQNAAIVIKLIDYKRQKESINYFNNDIFYIENKPNITLYSHSPDLKLNHYDTDNINHFEKVIINVLNEIDSMSLDKIDVEKEAIEYINNILPKFKNIGMFFSGGKDSLVGLKLLQLSNNLENVNIYFPNSHNDFQEVINIIEKYQLLFNISIQSFDNNNNKFPEQCSPFEWMTFKAEANNNLIKSKNLDLVLIQYRASDEGVRSKDYHIVNKESHYRFSPVFYFSEINIWRFIRKYKLPVCDLYYKGYRSLGDSFCTNQCMPSYSSIDEIIEYIENNPNTNERDGRIKQDKSDKYAMEKLRNVGFF